VNEEFGPVNQLRVDLLEGLGVVLRKLGFGPEFRGHVRALDYLGVEIEGPGFGGGTDGGVAGVGQGAGLAVAEAGYVVFVSAEVLVLGRSEVG